MNTEIHDWAAGCEHDPGRLRGFVWWCEDTYCDCTQARIERVEGSGPYTFKTLLWKGQFHSDGEPGATTELNHEAQRLRRHHHDLYRSIEWPWTRRASDASTETPRNTDSPAP